MEMNLNEAAKYIHKKLPHLELCDIEEVLVLETDYMVEIGMAINESEAQ